MGQGVGQGWEREGQGQNLQMCTYEGQRTSEQRPQQIRTLAADEGHCFIAKTA